jgi:transcriptional regulator with XRE-family HTH domain
MARHGGVLPVRISDVAKRAGVSVATVSKSLNGRPDVSAATRERVRQVADELGFSPNPQARSLPTGRTFAVGLLTTDVYGRFSLPLLLGAEDEFGADDVAVILSDTRDDPEREKRLLRNLMARKVDGIVVNGRRTARRLPLEGTGAMPIVYALTGATGRSALLGDARRSRRGGACRRTAARRRAPPDRAHHRVRADTCPRPYARARFGGPWRGRSVGPRPRAIRRVE